MVEIYIKPHVNQDALTTEKIIGQSEQVYAEKLQDRLEEEAGQENLLFTPPLTRGKEIVQELKTPNKMSAEDANARYGVPGYLKFEGPVSEDLAFQRNVRVARRKKVDEYLVQARRDDIGFFEKTENLFNYLKGGGLDQMAASLVGAEFLGGLGAARYLSRLPMTAPLMKNVLSKSLTFGALEETAFLPTRKQVYNDLGQEYSPLQMAADVTASGVIAMGGGAFRSFFGGRDALKRRALGPEGRAASKGGSSLPPDGGAGGGDVMSGEMDAVLSPAEQQNKIINQQMTPEGREVAAGYIQRSLDEGVEPNPKVVEDIMALSKKNNPPEIAGDKPFYSDYILRSDFDAMEPAQQMKDATDLAGRTIFDDHEFLNTAKALEIHGTTPEKLPSVMKNIINTVQNEGGVITKNKFIKQVTQSAQELGFSKQEIQALIKSYPTEVNGKINTNEAIALYQQMRQRPIGTQAANVNPAEAMSQVRRLQQELQKVNIDAEAKPGAFRKAFLDVKAKFDSFPELKNTTLAKLDNVSKEARQAAVDYLRYLQSANLSGDTIQKILGGNVKAIKEMQNSIQFNIKMKDGFNAKEVYDRLEKNIIQQDTHDLSTVGIPKTAQEAASINVPKIQLDETAHPSLSFMQEQIATLEKQIPEEQVAKLKKDLEPKGKMVGEDLEKMINMINCLKG